MFVVVRCLHLDEIFQCEQSFERIFLGAIFGSNAPYFIAGWRSDFLDQVKCVFSVDSFFHRSAPCHIKILNSLAPTRLLLVARIKQMNDKFYEQQLQQAVVPREETAEKKIEEGRRNVAI